MSTKKLSIFIPLIKYTCLYFLVASLFLNLLTFFMFLSDGLHELLVVWANLIVFLVCFIAGAIVVLIKNKSNRLNHTIDLLSFATFLYAIEFLGINIIGSFIGKIWTIYTILLIFAFSFLISLLRHIMKFKNYFLHALIYFFVFGIFYSLVVLTIAGYGSGNAIIIVVGIYSIAYIICALIYFFIKKHKEINENNKKKYTSQFK